MFIAAAPLVLILAAGAVETAHVPSAYMLAVSAGVGVDAYAKEHAGVTFDLGLTVARHFERFDLGLIGLARSGLEVAPEVRGGFGGELGAAAIVGHSFAFDRSRYLRASGGYGVVRAFHPTSAATTPHFALAELQLGATHESPRWSTYVRVCLPLGELSSAPEHRAVTLSAGVSLSN